MAKYSIILPVRNGGHYLPECVNSVLSQTFSEFNFIVLDNFSSDGTLEWLQSIKDDRIKIFPSKKSLTIEENWGRIVDIEKNEFITLIGHDDILYPNFLSVIDTLIKSHPNASLYHTHFNFIDANGDKIRPCRPMQPYISGYEFLKDFLAISIDSMGTGYMMRSADYNAVGGISGKYPNLLFADFELWLNICLKNCIVVSPETCFAFRKHQSTTGTAIDKDLHKALGIFVDYLFSLEQHDEGARKIIDEFGAQFLLFQCKGFSHRLLRTPIAKREKLTVADFIKQTQNMAYKLQLQDQYHPNREKSIMLAKMIDGNVALRSLFLLFKRWYKKPILK